ncbi:MAG: PH domain-containing protein [Actinobacteria bacterium]|nr:MAG: PH domain-containing protein [Actinomycetota bacterium]
MLAAAREPVRLNARRHGIVLARPLAWALAFAAAGVALATLAWPLPAMGAALVALGAGLALRAVVRWERTRVVVTTEKLFVVHGFFRRRAAAVRLERVGAVEVEQTLLGRTLGYGTLVAGNLEIPFVADPDEVVDLID